MHNSMANPVGAKNQKNVLCFNGAVRSTVEGIREGTPLSDDNEAYLIKPFSFAAEI
jgi:hypothetical protein